MNIKNVRNKLAAVSAIGMTALASAPAFAGELATAATEGMDKAELILIGVAVLSLCGVIALIRAGRRASS
ncbi:hypothetical protein [Stenotrophomonas maltophilia]|uniref:hypothetical protein n=1 Tax=Stenotrophomonas maltophilia TaxID=40324 RepID=UPI001FA760FF|nr:hypothetical protein [Stenotrophomonas maltophilia]